MASITDLSVDCLWHITKFLHIDDIALLLMTSKTIRNSLLEILPSKDKQKILKYVQAYMNMKNIVQDTLDRPIVRDSSGFCQCFLHMSWPKWNGTFQMLTCTLTPSSEHVILDTVTINWNKYDINEIEIVTSALHRILKSTSNIRVSQRFAISENVDSGLDFDDLWFPSVDYNPTYRSSYSSQWLDKWSYFTMLYPFYDEPNIQKAHEQTRSLVNSFNHIFSNPVLKDSELTWLKYNRKRVIIPSLNMEFELGSVHFNGNKYLLATNIEFYVPSHKFDLSIRIAITFMEEMFRMIGSEDICFDVGTFSMPMGWDHHLISNKYGSLVTYGCEIPDFDETCIWYKILS